LVATLHFSICFMSLVRGEQVARTSNSIPNLAGAVRAGLRVGLLPLMVGRATSELVLCFPPPFEIDSARWLVTSPEAYRQLCVRRFMAFGCGTDPPAQARLVAQLRRR
jgi:DNA-binding transcriptional LysR family regulator